MKLIILDTNTLMAIMQFEMDIFSEIDKLADFQHEIVILDKTKDELEKIIGEQKGKFQQRAKFALTVVKKKELRELKTEKENVDDLLVEFAQKGAVIVTQDKELKDRVKAVKGQVMTIRQKKRVIYG
ncbi:hypothetical protein GOV03_01365 [Candidatus Woesearchaeota archaeon]|nr:hypothetical protein [Candidatus Woesearchaeota archaeon]